MRSARAGVAALSRRPTLIAALLYGLVAIALVSPALLPGKTLSMSDQLRLDQPWAAVNPPPFTRAANPATENSDGTTQFRPFLQYAERRLPNVPLWNPH